MEESNRELSKEQSYKVCRSLAKLATDLKQTQERLAEKTDYQRTNISWLFSGHYSPHLEIIFTVLTAINELSSQTFTLKDIDVSTETDQ